MEQAASRRKAIQNQEPELTMGRFIARLDAGTSSKLRGVTASQVRRRDRDLNSNVLGQVHL